MGNAHASHHLRKISRKKNVYSPRIRPIVRYNHAGIVLWKLEVHWSISTSLPWNIDSSRIWSSGIIAFLVVWIFFQQLNISLKSSTIAGTLVPFQWLIWEHEAVLVISIRFTVLCYHVWFDRALLVVIDICDLQQAGNVIHYRQKGEHDQ